MNIDQKEDRLDHFLGHIALLGDSIFDNGIYVPGGPAVLGQLRSLLPQGWSTSLQALDGAITSDVRTQLSQLPAESTHLVVSCGGNDALRHLSVLKEPAERVFDGLARFAGIREEFARSYQDMLGAVIQTGRDVTVCTVYDRVPDLEPAAQAALAMFNELILREATANRIPLIDLRLVCNERLDYSELSPIEPSVQGGAKIASAICNCVLGGASGATTAVYT